MKKRSHIAKIKLESSSMLNKFTTLINKIVSFTEGPYMWPPDSDLQIFSYYVLKRIQTNIRANNGIIQHEIENGLPVLTLLDHEFVILARTVMALLEGHQRAIIAGKEEISPLNGIRGIAEHFAKKFSEKIREGVG